MSPLVVLVMFVDIVDRDVLEQEVPMDVDVSIKEKDTTKKGHVLKKLDARRKVDALKKACTRAVSKLSGKRANASKASSDLYSRTRSNKAPKTGLPTLKI